jgi:serine O-acetyltransferase
MNMKNYIVMFNNVVNCMESSVNLVDLGKILFNQIKSNFYFLSGNERRTLTEAIPIAMKRVENCFKHINNKYYYDGERITFNPFHSGQYLIFLYYLSNSVYKVYGDEILASKLYFLNKIMNSIDLYYQVEMPDVFFMEHPVGTVIGRANMKNNLIVYQNCTIGGSYIDNEIYYPEIGTNVTLFSYSCILGKSVIGENTIVSSHCYIKNEIIPNNSIVFGSSPNIIIKNNVKNLNFFK